MFLPYKILYSVHMCHWHECTIPPNQMNNVLQFHFTLPNEILICACPSTVLSSIRLLDFVNKTNQLIRCSCRLRWTINVSYLIRNTQRTQNNELNAKTKTKRIGKPTKFQFKNDMVLLIAFQSQSHIEFIAMVDVNQADLFSHRM